MAGHEKLLSYHQRPSIDVPYVCDKKLEVIIFDNTLKWGAPHVEKKRCPDCYDVWLATANHEYIKLVYIEVRKGVPSVEVVAQELNTRLSDRHPHNAMLLYKARVRDNEIFDRLMRRLFCIVPYLSQFKHMGE